MPKRSTASWSEDASTLSPGTPERDDSESCYSSDSDTGDEYPKLSPPPCTSTAWIIEHILESRSADEQLPLRVMFSFNSGQGLPSLKDVHQWWHFRKDGKKIISFLSSLDKLDYRSCTPTFTGLPDPTAALADQYGSLHSPHDRFMDPGNQRLLKIKAQESSNQARRASQGLPPSFVRKVVLTTIFRPGLADADFKQALAGLDYLRDFEDTRRCCLRETAQKMGIKIHNWRDVLRHNIRALEWVEHVLQSETVLESCYTRIYINLRIWTMIQELKEPVFYKPNLLAMLNTLFPPSIDQASNMPVKAPVLHRHRAGLYNLMVEVDSQPSLHRSQLVDLFIAKHFRRGTGHSWQETRMYLEKYMDLAESMIHQAKLVQGVGLSNPDFAPYSTRADTFEFTVNSPTTDDDNWLDTFKLPEGNQMDKKWIMPLDPLPQRPKVSLDASLIGNLTTSDAELQTQDALRPVPKLDLVPARSPLRSQEQTFIRPESPQLERRLKFHARCHSDSALLPPKRIREASHSLDSILTIQTSELRQMILAAIKSVTINAGETESKNMSERSLSTTSILSNTTDTTALQLIASRPLGKGTQSYQEGCSNTSPVKPVNSFKPHHRRTKSRPNVSLSKKDGVVTTKRSLVRRESSGLKDENGGFSRSPEMSSSPFDAASYGIPKPCPPKLRTQSSLYKFIQPGNSHAAEAYVEQRFPSFENHRTPETPSLQSKPSFSQAFNRPPLAHNNRRGNAGPSSRPSTSLSRRREHVNAFYLESPTFPFDHFPPPNQSTLKGNETKMKPEKVITPLTENFRARNSFDIMNDLPSPGLEKQSSFTYMARPSISADEDNGNRRAESPYLEMIRTTPKVPFSRTPSGQFITAEQQRPHLKKQRSFGFLEDRNSQNIMALGKISIDQKSRMPRSPFMSPKSPLFGGSSSPKKSIKKKNSLPTMRFRSTKTPSVPASPEYLYFETNDPNERLIITRPYTSLSTYSPPASPRPTTPSSPRRRLQKAKSSTSLRSQNNEPSISSPSRGFFGRKSKEIVFTSADIEEPFPPHLHASIMRLGNSSEPNVGRAKKEDMSATSNNQPAWWAMGSTQSLTEKYMPITEESYDEFRRKEYARRWYLEEARARRKDMNGPTGGPFGADNEVDEVEQEKRGGVRKVFGKQASEKSVGVKDDNGKELREGPRATKKELTRPQRTKLDGIFGLKFGKSKEATKLGYMAVNVGKYDKY